MAACGHLLAAAPADDTDLAALQGLLPVVHVLLVTGHTLAADLPALASCLAQGQLPLLHRIAQEASSERSQAAPGGSQVSWSRLHHAEVSIAGQPGPCLLHCCAREHSNQALL